MYTGNKITFKKYTKTINAYRNKQNVLLSRPVPWESGMSLKIEIHKLKSKTQYSPERKRFTQIRILKVIIWINKKTTSKLLLELVIALVYITKVWAQRSYIYINRDNHILLAGQTASSWARTLIQLVLHSNTMHPVSCWAHNDRQE